MIAQRAMPLTIRRMSRMFVALARPFATDTASPLLRSVSQPRFSACRMSASNPSRCRSWKRPAKLSGAWAQFECDCVQRAAASKFSAWQHYLRPRYYERYEKTIRAFSEIVDRMRDCCILFCVLPYVWALLGVDDAADVATMLPNRVFNKCPTEGGSRRPPCSGEQNVT